MNGYDNEAATISLEDVSTPPRKLSVTINTVEDDLVAKRHKEMRTQKSTVSSRRKQAVCVRCAFKMYGSKKNPNVILDGLNMTVPKGAIYGLLGASGCGKTTLLSCIVGRRRLNSGEIWVLGGRPGSPGSGVPGPRIGYMPQEVALFGEFTIRETMIYFGWIAGMSTKEVEERLEFLVSLLQLPSYNKHVKNLSGGQQRRVSLAAALIHDPELLILDEPTVGVDPVLRQSIWDHLVDITQGGRTTVIITTHYIDETKQASLIGLMRGGRFLAEESPSELMRRNQAESLEDVFLKLSVLQNKGKRRRSSIAKGVVEKVELPAAVTDPAGLDIEDVGLHGEISGEFGDNVSMSSRTRSVIVTTETGQIESLPPDEEPPEGCLERIKPMKWHHMKALIWKNFSSLFRNFGILAFIVILPLSQMFFFCIAIGHLPTDLPIGVVNYELQAANLTHCSFNETTYKCPRDNETWTWNLTLFSCNYLYFLGLKQHNLMNYDTTEQALEEARIGTLRAVMVIPWNFTESLQKRVTDSRVDNYTLQNAAVEVHLDNTDKQVEWMLKADMQLSLMKASEHLALTCGLPERIMSSPVHFLKPVYGVSDPDFTDFAAPGVILTIIFFLAVALTSGSMLADRNSGILERSLVSGITGTEILFSHVTVQMLVMVTQSVVVLIIGFLAFKLTIIGSLGWVIFLVLITGLCGMTFGFAVSCLCDTERTATYLALGSFLPIVMLCGIIWPIEGIHVTLRWISIILPLTKSTESLRSMLQKGWGIEEPVVYTGFISTSVWITLYLTTSILLIKFKKG